MFGINSLIVVDPPTPSSNKPRSRTEERDVNSNILTMDEYLRNPPGSNDQPERNPHFIDFQAEPEIEFYQTSDNFSTAAATTEAGPLASMFLFSNSLQVPRIHQVRNRKPASKEKPGVLKGWMNSMPRLYQYAPRDLSFVVYRKNGTVDTFAGSSGTNTVTVSSPCHVGSGQNPCHVGSSQNPCHVGSSQNPFEFPESSQNPWNVASSESLYNVGSNQNPFQFHAGSSENQFRPRGSQNPFQFHVGSNENQFRPRSSQNPFQFHVGSNESQFRPRSSQNNFRAGSSQNPFQVHAGSRENQFHAGRSQNHFLAGGSQNPNYYGNIENAFQCHVGSSDNLFRIARSENPSLAPSSENPSPHFGSSEISSHVASSHNPSHGSSESLSHIRSSESPSHVASTENPSDSKTTQPEISTSPIPVENKIKEKEVKPVKKVFDRRGSYAEAAARALIKTSVNNTDAKPNECSKNVKNEVAKPAVNEPDPAPKQDSNLERMPTPEASGVGVTDNVNVVLTGTSDVACLTDDVDLTFTSDVACGTDSVVSLGTSDCSIVSEEIPISTAEKPNDKAIQSESVLGTSLGTQTSDGIKPLTNSASIQTSAPVLSSVANQTDADGYFPPVLKLDAATEIDVSICGNCDGLACPNCELLKEELTSEKLRRYTWLKKMKEAVAPKPPKQLPIPRNPYETEQEGLNRIINSFIARDPVPVPEDSKPVPDRAAAVLNLNSVMDKIQAFEVSVGTSGNAAGSLDNEMSTIMDACLNSSFSNGVNLSSIVDDWISNDDLQETFSHDDLTERIRGNDEDEVID